MPPLVVVYHEGYLTPYYTSTVECPARVKAIFSKLHNRFPVVTPAPGGRRDILRVHTPSMANRVEAEDRDTYEAALLAVGGAIRASEEALRGIPAFAPVRPPGHHAGINAYRGFCYFNNIAVATAGLLARGAIASALVLDLDHHHGDGTEEIFRDSQAVRFVNVRAETRTAYLERLEQVLDESWEADLLAVSAGFDTYIHDWGGILYREDYRAIGGMLRDAARRCCQGRCFATLEGGYYLPELGSNVLAFCEGLAGM